MLIGLALIPGGWTIKQAARRLHLCASRSCRICPDGLGSGGYDPDAIHVPASRYWTQLPAPQRFWDVPTKGSGYDWSVFLARSLIDQRFGFDFGTSDDYLMGGDRSVRRGNQFRRWMDRPAVLEGRLPNGARAPEKLAWALGQLCRALGTLKGCSPVYGDYFDLWSRHVRRDWMNSEAYTRAMEALAELSDPSQPDRRVAAYALLARGLWGGRESQTDPASEGLLRELVGQHAHPEIEIVGQGYRWEILVLRGRKSDATRERRRLLRDFALYSDCNTFHLAAFRERQFREDPTAGLLLPDWPWRLRRISPSSFDNTPPGVLVPFSE